MLVVTLTPEVRLATSMPFTVVPRAAVVSIAPVCKMFNVSVPVPPSIESRLVKVAAPASDKALNVSAPAVPVNKEPASTPVVSVIARSPHILLRIKDLRQF